MNTLSIAHRLMLNVLQNMNIKRDTLEKRAFIKTQFQETTLQPTAIISGSSQVSGTGSVKMETNSETHEITPSIEEQYLPKSLRGANSNPYSIMNATIDNTSVSTSLATVPNVMDDATTTAMATTMAMATNLVERFECQGPEGGEKTSAVKKCKLQ